MKFDFQMIATLMIVAAAGGYLLRKIYCVLFRGTGFGCGTGCSSCEQSSPNKQLVDLKPNTMNVSTQPAKNE